MTADMGTFVALREIKKQFGGVPALHDVSMEIGRGEVVGLIGANGAGKSTLMRILAGSEQPDGGEIVVRGGPARFSSPRAALQTAGIALVPQEIELVHGETVGHNLLVANLPSRYGVVRERVVHDRAIGLLEQVGLGSIDPRTSVDGLTPVEQRLLTIAVALAEGPRLLILDEPSAALPVDATARLWPILESLRGRGSSVVYVSHRLEEVQRVADRVIAMRDGEAVATLGRTGRSVETMVELVSGKSREEEPPPVEVPHGAGAPVVELRDVTGQRVDSVTLTVHSGEVLGVGGLQGAGRSELLRLIFGAQKPSGGSVSVMAESVRNPVVAARKGVGYVAEGRARMVLHGMDVTANATIAALQKLVSWLLLSGRREQAAAEELAERIRLKGNLQADIKTLSGGNQQKAVLGRWLLNESRLFVLDEPTAGIDVGTRAEIHRMLRALASDGATVIVASAEPEELRLLCDRVIILVEGRLAEEFRAPFDVEMIVAASFARGGHEALSSHDRDEPSGQEAIDC